MARYIVDHPGFAAGVLHGAYLDAAKLFGDLAVLEHLARDPNGGPTIEMETRLASVVVQLRSIVRRLESLGKPTTQQVAP